MSTTRRACMQTLLFAAGLLTASFAAHAANGTNEDQSYTWSAELVSYDEDARAMTVRAPVETHAEIENLSSFSEGDRVTIVWTGRFWAAGVRDIVRNADSAEGFLKLPAEFVGAEDDGSYVSFRVRVPSDDASRIASVEPGDEVRVRSPRSASSRRNAVSAAAPYNADFE